MKEENAIAKGALKRTAVLKKRPAAAKRKEQAKAASGPPGGDGGDGGDGGGDGPGVPEEPDVRRVGQPQTNILYLESLRSISTVVPLHVQYVNSF